MALLILWIVFSRMLYCYEKDEIVEGRRKRIILNREIWLVTNLVRIDMGKTDIIYPAFRSLGFAVGLEYKRPFISVINGMIIQRNFLNRDLQLNFFVGRVELLLLVCLFLSCETCRSRSVNHIVFYYKLVGFRWRMGWSSNVISPQPGD